MYCSLVLLIYSELIWVSLAVCGFSHCGAQRQLPQGVWDLPFPGMEPTAPASASRFPTLDH